MRGVTLITPHRRNICAKTKESLLDMFLLDLLEELCDNRLEECIDSWVFEVEKNQELLSYFRNSDIAILTLSTFLCFELQQPQKLEVLKEFILHEYGSSGLLSQCFSNFTMVVVFIYFVCFFFKSTDVSVKFKCNCIMFAFK